MDRAIVIYTLLLVGLTWLLYKLTALMEPGGEKSASKTNSDIDTPNVSSRKPIHQRLHK